MRTRPALARVAPVFFALFVGALALVLAELGLRLLGGADGVSVEDVGRPAWMDPDTFERFQAASESIGRNPEDLMDIESWHWDSRLRWLPRPNVDVVVPNIFLDTKLGDEATWRLRTNARGYRTPEFQPEKPPGTVRVVLVGDSNTMGWLLDDEDTYARRIEQQLSLRLDRPVEVINLGVSGLTTFGCRIVVQEVALALDPDALIVSCGANDPQLMAMSDADYAELQASLLGRIQSWAGQLRLAKILQRLRPETRRSNVARVDAGDFESNLSAIFQAANRQGVDATYLRICCCTPSRAAALERVTRRTNTPVVRAREILATFAQPEVQARHREALARVESWYPRGELRRQPFLTMLFRDHCHLNPLGTDVVGDALAEHLASRLGGASGETDSEG